MRRRDVISAIRKVARNYGANGTEISEIISNAFDALADEIEQNGKARRREIESPMENK